MRRTKIIGTGSYLPKKRLTNLELAAEYKLDTSDAWIRERTGIGNRHIAAPDEATSDMALHASREALARAGIGIGALKFPSHGRSVSRYLFCPRLRIDAIGLDITIETDMRDGVGVGMRDRVVGDVHRIEARTLGGPSDLDDRLRRAELLEGTDAERRRPQGH